MPYTPDKVSYDDTIRNLADKTNKVMDGVVQVQQETGTDLNLVIQKSTTEPTQKRANTIWIVKEG